MGDLSKSKREERAHAASQGNAPQAAAPQFGAPQPGVSYPGPAGGGGSTAPLAAYGSLDNRLDMSQGVLHQPPPGFRVEDGVVVPDDARLRKARRRGPGVGGGRWQRFAFLAVILLAVVLLMVLGVQRLVGGALVAKPELPAGSGFPVSAAAGYVERFNRIYFTWDANGPNTRAGALAQYFPNLAASGEAGFGWSQQGTQFVSDNPVALRIDASDDHHAVITTGMTISTPQANGAAPRTDFVCSAVSVFAQDKDSMVIDSWPALVSCPTPARINIPDETPDTDTKNTPDITQMLNSFFKAYGASDLNNLNPLVASNANVGTGLNGSRQFVGVDVTVLSPKKGDDPNIRQVEAKVTWGAPGVANAQNPNSVASSPSQYLVTVRRSDNAGRWIVLKLQPTIPTPDLRTGESSSPNSTPSSTPSSSTSASSNAGTPQNGTNPSSGVTQ